MRVYIQVEEQKTIRIDGVPHQRSEETYYLLENIESFAKRFVGGKWRIDALLADTSSGARHLALAEGLDDSRATHIMDGLLRCTSDRGEGTAIVSWTGTGFTTRTL